MAKEAFDLFDFGSGFDTPPPILYHYTSAEALLSIVHSERMRATHIKYLNDSSETAWMWRIVLKRLEARQESVRSHSERTVLAELIQMVSNPRQLNEFVASFSEKGDDLSQWRAYCPGASGYSIGFTASALRTQWIADPAGGEPSFVGGSLRKVKYLDENDTVQLDEKIDKAFGLAPGLDGMMGLHGPITQSGFVLGCLSVMAPAYKHPAFRDEAEWRMLLTTP